MGESSLTWTSKLRAGSICVLSFHGRGGIGSGGIPDRDRMREAVRGALTIGAATGLVIDLTDFEYRFGGWITSVPLAATKALGTRRVCLVAVGETAASLRPLWELTCMDRIAPLFDGLDEAVRYILGAEPG